MDEMIGTTETARRLGVSSRRVHALIDEGRLPAKKVGRTWIIRVEDLERVRDRKPGYPSGRPRGTRRAKQEA